MTLLAPYQYVMPMSIDPKHIQPRNRHPDANQDAEAHLTPSRPSTNQPRTCGLRDQHPKTLFSLSSMQSIQVRRHLFGKSAPSKVGNFNQIQLVQLLLSTCLRFIKAPSASDVAYAAAAGCAAKCQRTPGRCQLFQFNRHRLFDRSRFDISSPRWARSAQLISKSLSCS